MQSWGVAPGTEPLWVVLAAAVAGLLVVVPLRALAGGAHKRGAMARVVLALSSLLAAAALGANALGLPDVVEGLQLAALVALIAGLVGVVGFSVFDLLLGGVPSWVIARARVDVPEASRAIVCAPPAEPLSLSASLPTTAVYLGPGGDKYFGGGWGRVWPTAFGFERELSDPEAELMLPLGKPSPVAVGIRLGGAADGGTAELLVNGQSLGTRPYATAWNTLDWATPAAAWIDGLNRVTLRIKGGALPRVRRITLAPPEAALLR